LQEALLPDDCCINQKIGEVSRTSVLVNAHGMTQHERSSCNRIDYRCVPKLHILQDMLRHPDIFLIPTNPLCNLRRCCSNSDVDDAVFMYKDLCPNRHRPHRPQMPQAVHLPDIISIAQPVLSSIHQNGGPDVRSAVLSPTPGKVCRSFRSPLATSGGSSMRRCRYRLERTRGYRRSLPVRG
jgi:hypothetical protein